MEPSQSLMMIIYELFIGILDYVRKIKFNQKLESDLKMFWSNELSRSLKLSINLL